MPQIQGGEFDSITDTSFSINFVAVAGRETRPRNIAFNYIVRAA